MPLSVVGAGLGRTGTVSLKIALETLGFGPCYHMVEVMAEAHRPDDWIKAADGRLGWEEIFEGYSATVDYPGCLFWRELAALYPDSKVLLSVRDPHEWFESTQATIFSPQSRQGMAETPFGRFVQHVVLSRYGDRVHDRDFMTAEFQRHVDEVRDTVPGDRLLVYQVSEGWEPLCSFLEVPAPDVPFPRANTRQEFAAHVAERRSSGGESGTREFARQMKDRIDTLRSGDAAEPAAGTTPEK